MGLTPTGAHVHHAFQVGIQVAGRTHQGLLPEHAFDQRLEDRYLKVIKPQHLWEKKWEKKAREKSNLVEPQKVNQLKNTEGLRSWLRLPLSIRPPEFTWSHK